MSQQPSLPQSLQSVQLVLTGNIDQMNILEDHHQMGDGADAAKVIYESEPAPVVFRTGQPDNSAQIFLWHHGFDSLFPPTNPQFSTFSGEMREIPACAGLRGY
jgi:hypothetical protein